MGATLGTSKKALPSLSYSIGTAVMEQVFPSPLQDLEKMFAVRTARVSRDEVLEVATKCFIAGQFASAVPILVRAYQLTVVRSVIEQAINGALCPPSDALELLLQPCRKTGCTTLHMIGQNGNIFPRTHTKALVELLEFLKGSKDNLDHLMSLNHEGQHPLFLAMRGAGTDGSLEFVRRVSPEHLWSEVTTWQGRKSTALHAACSSSHFTDEDRKEIVSRIPLDVLATCKGPYGRTVILQAAASRSDSWAEALLDCLPPSALEAVDEAGCSIFHLMCFLSPSLQERILELAPNAEANCSRKARIDANCMRCYGNAAVCHMARRGGPGVAGLISLTSDESLFACEYMIGEFANARCSLLHMAAGRANVGLCEMIFARVSEEHRSALTAKDGFGQTPLHILFEIPGNNGCPGYIYGRAELFRCTTAIVVTAFCFLKNLTDDELKVTGKNGISVLEQLLLMMSRASGSAVDTTLFDICQELLERTPKDCRPSSHKLLSYVFRISRHSSLQCEKQVQLVESLLKESIIDDFYGDGNLYLDVMRNHPNLEAARLLLDATPADAFKHTTNRIPMLCNMLVRETPRRPDMSGMLELLLEYLPPAMLLEGNGPREPAPFRVAVTSGATSAVATMLAVYPEARTATFQIGEDTMTALELAESKNHADVVSLLQPNAKNAGCS